MWMGPDNGNVNTTHNCEYDIANDIPCFKPLVWTTGSNRFNGLEAGDAIGNVVLAVLYHVVVSKHMKSLSLKVHVDGPGRR